MKLSTFNPTLTALQSLVAIVGVRAGTETAKQSAKVARHTAIVNATALVVALHLCNQPPKGMGNPADAGKLVSTFQHAGLKNYAEHATAIRAALATPDFKGRSIAEWDDAVEAAEILCADALSGCAPKQYTSAELKAKAEKREEKKAEREAANKANAEKDAAAAAERAISEAQKRLTGQIVADLIRVGAFDDAGLNAIMDALAAIGVAKVEDPVTV